MWLLIMQQRAATPVAQRPQQDQSRRGATLLCVKKNLLPHKTDLQKPSRAQN